MDDAFSQSLSLVDVSGYLIIAAILAFLAISIALTFLIRARYWAIERDLKRFSGQTGGFNSKVLNRIVDEVATAMRATSGDVNTQAIIEHHFQEELNWLQTGERFVKAATGLMIILGLVGTFYGLTLSIGKLVSVISADSTQTVELTQSLTKGLTEAVSGMSVAFSTSLFGILAAIVLTLVGVFWSVTARRLSVMVQIEKYLDNVLLGAARGAPPHVAVPADAAGANAFVADRLDRLVAGFGQSVSELQGTVTRFENALQAFATTTRDFREFNMHLKDNVQRMSLSFGDLSETVKQHVSALKSGH